jgi:peptide subunit release factor 1 (eRF1)
MKLFLIGTSHTLQKGLIGAPEGCYAEFKGIVRQVAQNNLVKTIGEEMSKELLINTVSLCEEVAKELDILHIFCDPNKSERKSLDLPESDCPTTWSPRENEWLNRLNSAQFPILFVCGANHVDSFAQKCDDKGIAVAVLERDWEPFQKIPLEYRII